MVEGYQVSPSAMSRAGQSFIMANEEEVPNEGEVHLLTFSDELVRTDQRWQVADIGKPLLSVDEEVDKDQWVVLTRRGGFIHRNMPLVLYLTPIFAPYFAILVSSCTNE